MNECVCRYGSGVQCGQRQLLFTVTSFPIAGRTARDPLTVIEIVDSPIDYVLRSGVTEVLHSRIELVTRAVDWNHPDAQALRAAMSAEVGPRYADRAALMARTQANAVDEGSVHRTFVVYRKDTLGAERAVGHAALRWNGPDLELKRMFVDADHRGTGVSTALLAASENAAREQGLPRLILQTGDRQPDAVRLYEKSGYTRIPVFAPYDVLPFSNTFEKRFRVTEAG